MELKMDEFILSDDKERLNINKIHSMLSKSYWASNRSIETVYKSMQNSICFGIYVNDQQVGFARVITDEAVTSYICDVIIDELFRGKGLGKWLMKSIVNHPKISHTRQILATKDAHGLYEKYGFERIEAMRKQP